MRIQLAIRLFAIAALTTSLFGASGGGSTPGTRHSGFGKSSTPIANLRPQGATFFAQVQGVSYAQPMHFFNGGTVPLTNIKVSVSGPFSFSNLCPPTLGVGASCIIQVQFVPSATGGPQTGLLSISDNAPNSPQTTTLVGTATASAILMNPPGGLSFGPQVVGTVSGQMTMAITNPAANAMTVTSVVASGDFSEINDCTTVPVVGTPCLVAVTFKPTDLGTRTGTLTITDSGSDSPQVYNLSGVGASHSISLSNSKLTFPAQNVGTASSPLRVKVSNAGASALSIIGITASGDFAQTNTCPSSLAPGTNCLVTVTFAPSATGVRNGQITISDTDPANLQRVQLTGQGQVPASTVTVSPRTASITFTLTQQFTASINGGQSSDVTWAVDGIPGGNSSVGTIDSTGLYTPPNTAGSQTITATSNADPTQSASVPMVVTNYAGTYTYHNDLARTGQNLGETVLTTGNVNAGQFGKLFSYPVDGKIYSQPLYVANVNIPNQGFHNVVYVTTEHDSIYAFDADGRTTTPLWHVSFINPPSVTTVPASLFTCSSLQPEIGITGTPVIDPAGILYVVVKTAEANGSTTNYVQRLHALDITTGNDLGDSPVVIQPSVPGSGMGNDGQGNIPFDGLKQLQRPGLVLLNGSLYIAFGGLCDNNPYHGWLVQYNASNLQQGAAFNTSPNDWGAPIWQSGSAPAADADGNLYFATGNGDFDLNFGGGEMGDSVLKISTSGGALSLLDYFTPYEEASLFHFDLDLTSGGTLVLPDQPTGPTHLAVAGGKEGNIYLINRDDMGELNPNIYDNQIVQEVLHGAGKLTPYPSGGTDTNSYGIWSMPAYFQNQIYYTGVDDVPKAFRLFGGQLSPFPISKGSSTFRYPGAEFAISANGSTNGIAWTALESPSGIPVVLYAYDAADLSRQLYNSTGTPTGLGDQFVIPTVANGRVYMGTASELDVFGLLP